MTLYFIQKYVTDSVGLGWNYGIGVERKTTTTSKKFKEIKRARPKVPHWNFFGRSWGESKTSRIDTDIGRIDISAHVSDQIS